MNFIRIFTGIQLCIILTACALEGQIITQSRSIQVSHVPFGSKKNSIELVVMNKGIKKTAEFVVSAVETPEWLTYVSESETIRYNAKVEEAVVRFEFDLTPPVPVGKEQTLRFAVASATTGERWTKEIKIIIDAPKRFELFQNYPNPFNPSTVISYQLPVNSYVTVKAYNMLGQEVATLVDGVQEAGHQSVEFDAGRFSSGMYFYRISAGKYSAVKKMLLLK